MIYMKFNYKSKLGFTLIELLVVIGILAVLAAIAIPSVAGLIDRANVSADATNANEMTNAIERFTSEYELYCQDIASGRVKEGDLDSAQGRVFNVTGADSREDIELLESTGLDGKQINRDTKYPENVATMQALVENYMKTSSTTFTPKQSDCHYYYSPDCGVVVCTETAKSSVTDLNKLIQSGKDAKGNTLGDTTQWIDLTNNTVNNTDNNGPKANDNKYEYGVGDPDVNPDTMPSVIPIADYGYHYGSDQEFVISYEDFQFHNGVAWCDQGCPIWSDSCQYLDCECVNCYREIDGYSIWICNRAPDYYLGPETIGGIPVVEIIDQNGNRMNMVDLDLSNN
jgi:prepilin-type N-terminal cleavage/methylation domain-containing protein